MSTRVELGALIPIALLLAWETLARSHAVSSYVLPSISSVLWDLAGMARDGTLFTHLGATFARVACGALLGALAGSGLGLVVGLSRKSEEYLDPLIQGVRSVPSLAWVPLLLLWMGIDEAPKITLIIVGSFFPVYLNVVSGVRGV